MTSVFILEQAKEMNVFGVTVLRMWPEESAMRDWIIGSIGSSW
jgi:hypothetical protein